MAISPRMNSRLEAISTLVQNGYTVKKEWDAIPYLVAANGTKKRINLFSNLAGFSWIGFLWPFAVCTQIKEWSYFYVSGFLYLITSIISAVIHSADIRFYLPSAIGIAISVMYGMYFPYLRYLAREKKVEENSVGFSIVLGLLLTIVSMLPSIVIDLIAFPS